MPSRRFALSLLASLLIHVAVFGADSFKALLQPPPPPRLQATLRIPDAPPPAEPLLKNTLDRDEEKPAVEARPVEAPPKPAARPERAGKKQVQAAQRKIAEHTYYPPEAIARGIEGDVRLLLVLGEDGSVAEVQVAASSGHAILDNAAVRAAYAMGRLPGVTARELILPVSFRLR